MSISEFPIVRVQPDAAPAPAPTAESAVAAPPADTGDAQRLIPTARIFTVPADEESGVPAQTLAIHRFKFVKSLMLLEALGELAEKVDVASIFAGDEGIRIDMLIDKLPVLMRTMRPVVVKALALTLAPNKAIEQMAEDELSAAVVLAPYRQMVNRLEIAEAAELLTIAVERIGVQEIRRNFPALLAALRAN